MIAIGLYFILPKIEWLNADFTAILLPVILIIMGITIFFSPKVTRKIKWEFNAGSSVNSNHSTKDGFVNSETIFGSVQQIVMDEVFKGATIKNTFGGTVLTLEEQP